MIPFALGVVARLDVDPGEDGDDPVLQVDAVFSIVVLAFLGIDDRIGEPEVGAFIVVLVEREDEQAIMLLRPLVVGVDVLL